MSLWNNGKILLNGASVATLLLVIFGDTTCVFAQTSNPHSKNSDDESHIKANALPPVTVIPDKLSAKKKRARRPVVSPTPTRTADTSTTVLDPIIVTARKTNERLQDVPESITVVHPEELTTAPFASAPAIARNSPNVQWVDRGAGTQFFSIRGVSSLGTPLNFSDGTVGFNVDGVPNSMLSASNAMLDVNRIEVLRGPQGTLWGTNALGGVINVIPNEPDGQRDIRFTTELGSNGYRMGEAIVGGNIIPGALDGRMAIRFGHQDGDIRSLFTDDLGKRDISAFRGGLRFTGLDNTTVTLSGSYLSDKGNAPPFVLRGAPGFPVSGTPTEPYAKTTHGDVTLKVEHDFDQFHFTSISAYQHNERDMRTDAADKLVFDRLGMPLLSIVGSTLDKENIYSQELRLSSLDGDPIRWVVGASVVRTEGSRRCDSLQCTFPFPTTAATTATIDSTSYGAFGDISIPFAERWEVSAGARVSYDDIDAGFTNAQSLPGLNGSNSTTQTYPTGRLALSYKWTDDIRTYVSLARGHSTRVYPLLPTVRNGVLPDPYPAATGWTYEAGVKASLFNDRLQIDGSVFYNDVKNGLIAYLDPLALAFKQTYQDYETSGFELQGRAKITDELSFIGGVGYTHSSLGAGGLSGNKIEGNRVPNTPDWTFTTALQYDAPGSVMNLPGAFSFNVQYQFNGSRAADPDDSFDLKPYHIVNARVGWKNDGGDFEVYAFGRNLLDERYEAFGAPLGRAQTVNVGPGRIVGVGITKTF
jgi:iron complex outermembrane receptor protein